LSPEDLGDLSVDYSMKQEDHPMVTDRQVRKLMKLNQQEEKVSHAAAKAGMSENTARKYLRVGKLPSQCKPERTWRTREDPFEAIGDQARSMLEVNPGLEAKTLFEWFQRQYPGVYQDGQLRTFQRRVKYWRAIEGPAKEVYFPQVHSPGVLCASDFTHVSSLGITIGGEVFSHLLYHFVLPYSNWETGTVCFSESFESLSTGLQNALWELGGVPKQHRTDRLSAAVQEVGKGGEAEFTRSYQALLRHYGLQGQKIRTGKSHENGDIEQRHYRFKNALEQALLLRESRDFSSRQAYKEFLCELFSQLNAGRRQRLLEELNVLRALPLKRLNDYSVFHVRVGPSSTIRVAKNVYSVHSRLIDEHVSVRLYAEYLEIWYAQKKVETIPRLRGAGKHRIQYRHIIEWLRRKPGAFENYRYLSDLFPTSRFRMAYDQLKSEHPSRAHKAYLDLLYLAARETESGVDEALRVLFEQEQRISIEAVKTLMTDQQGRAASRAVVVEKPDLCLYDRLLDDVESHVDNVRSEGFPPVELTSEALHAEEVH
jgi:hypothetical protein